MRFSIPVDTDFNFPATVLSHGWYMLAPFSWDEGEQRLDRVLEVGDRVLPVSILSRDGGLDIVTDHVTEPEQRSIHRQVRQMLRLDEDLSGFWQVARRLGRPLVARWRLGRMLRSPTVFEDVVKVLLTVNTNWRRTVAMAARLTAELGRPGHGLNAFPGPRAIAQAGEQGLNRMRFGYRSKYLAVLAADVAAGRIDLDRLRDPAVPSEQAREMLLRMPGVGPYAAASILALLGRYGWLPVDSELIAHITRATGSKPTAAQLKVLYGEWGEYRYLGYWTDHSGERDS